MEELEDSTNPNNVLLLEDNSEDRMQIRLHLELMGFVVYDTPSPIEAKEIFNQHDFSLVIIHLGHKQLESLETCRWVRAASTVPVIMLTDRKEFVDEEMVMSAGADDYVSKPIESKILTSRITQQLKRGQTQRAPRANILTWSDLQMDLSQHSFKVKNKEVFLTNMEFQFLQLLMENPHRVFSRNQILEAIGVMKGIGTDHIVDTHASRIRSKIKAEGGPPVISVVRSVGFKLANAK
ncbi:MAG: Transcriptional regulatory protein WalR [Actinomycetota bacterium]|jgi:two-component system OmpR family response regulator/two-component system alkaline phosphatase synthesis response regulator PhoP